MNRFTRRNFLMSAVAGIAAPTLIMPRASRAAESSFKFGTNLPANHPLNIRANEAAERIMKETGGQVRINVFPNNQLGNDADMLSHIRHQRDFLVPRGGFHELSGEDRGAVAMARVGMRGHSPAAAQGMLRGALRAILDKPYVGFDIADDIVHEPVLRDCVAVELAGLADGDVAEGVPVLRKQAWVGHQTMAQDEELGFRRLPFGFDVDAAWNFHRDGDPRLPTE